jgi:hypothetical protein
MKMKKTKITATCLGDLRLSAIDVGFDLREQNMSVRLPDDFSSVGLDGEDGQYLIEGTRKEMIAEIKKAGYVIVE